MCLQANCSSCLIVPRQISSDILQIHEKEEQEMNEKNDNASCLSEEPLISADRVIKFIPTYYNSYVKRPRIEPWGTPRVHGQIYQSTVKLSHNKWCILEKSVKSKDS